MKRTLCALAVIATATATGCNAKAGGEQIEKKITEILAGDGLVTSKVTCPKTIATKVDSTFTCQVTFDNGEMFPVEGVVTSKSGSKFEYNVKITSPHYVAAKLEKIIIDGITAQRTAPKSVTCGAPGIHRSPPDGKLDCVAVDDAGTNHKAVFTFTADGLPDRWEVVD